MRREARKFLGYFVWKITILSQKIIFFPILGGARAGCAPSPPWIRTCTIHVCTGTCTFLIWKTRLVVPTTNIDIFDANKSSKLPHRRMGHGFRFLLPPFLYYPPFFQNVHINHSFFKIFIIIRFSSSDNISRRHTSWIIRVFCVHSFSTDTV